MKEREDIYAHELARDRAVTDLKTFAICAAGWLVSAHDAESAANELGSKIWNAIDELDQCEARLRRAHKNGAIDASASHPSIVDDGGATL